MAKNGWDFREAVDHVHALLGTVEPVKAKPVMSEQDIRASLRRVWLDTEPVGGNSAAGRWLARRCGLSAAPAALRAISRMAYRSDVTSWHPGMVALVSAPDGRPHTLHRTFLTPAGEKAPVPEARRLMPGRMVKGIAVRLAPPAEEIGIGEGIETVLSASALFDVPCWSALTAGFLKDWEPPPEARRVIVFGDNDASCTGQEAAYALAKRLVNRGLSVEVRIPPMVGEDWNDVHTHAMEAA
ncbi:toprim domain-containing protein [Xanthobacter sediminis]